MAKNPGSDVPMEVREFLSKIGTKGGKIGGKRSLETMTAKQRSERARKAAAASAKVRSKRAKAKKQAARVATKGAR